MQRVIEPKKLLLIVLIVLGVLVWIMPAPDGLDRTGQQTLSFVLVCIGLWSTGFIPASYTTFFMFVGMLLTGTAGGDELFSFFLSPLMWLIVGSYLISQAVSASGLAERLSYILIGRFADSYARFILLIALLNLLLGVMIPQPFPRVILLMSIVWPIIEQAQTDDKTRRILGMCVFVTASTSSVILLNGDALLNGAVYSLSGHEISWSDWLVRMAVPGIIFSVLSVLCFYFAFGWRRPFMVIRSELEEKRAQFGALKPAEMKAAIWTVAAIALWATEAWHGINPAWVAMLCCVGMAVPKVGGLLTDADLSHKVDWNILFFVAGALALGTIAEKTGMSVWLLKLLIPDGLPDHTWMMLMVVVVVSIVIHMVIGSAFATLSMVTPPMIALFPELDALVVAMTVYAAVGVHFILPFHNVVVMIGAGKIGRYSSSETAVYGIPLTIAVLIYALILLPLWWTLSGVL